MIRPLRHILIRVPWHDIRSAPLNRTTLNLRCAVSRKYHAEKKVAGRTLNPSLPDYYAIRA